MVKQISSAAVLDALHEIVRGATAATADSIHLAAIERGIKVDWKRIGAGNPVDRFASLSVKEILDTVLRDAPPLEGELIVVTDNHYPDGLLVSAEDLRPTLESTESWIGGDVIIVSPIQRRLIVIHHEGACAHIVT